MRYETSTLPTASDLNAFLRELLSFFVRTRDHELSFCSDEISRFLCKSLMLQIDKNQDCTMMTNSVCNFRPLVPVRALLKLVELRLAM
jgi:hypothetical protein